MYVRSNQSDFSQQAPEHQVSTEMANDQAQDAEFRQQKNSWWFYDIIPTKYT